MHLRPRLIVSTAVTLAAAGLVPTGPAGAAEVTCFDQPATIVATADHQLLIGTDGPDVISSAGFAFASIQGMGGDDLLCNDSDDAGAYGGAGDDRITVRGASATGMGGEGDDVIVGSGRRSGVHGGDGNDTLRLESDGGASVDVRAYGNAGDDVISTAPGVDWGLVVGGPGNDSIVSTGSASTVQVDPGTGDDVVSGDTTTILDYTEAEPLTFDVSAGVVEGQGHDTFTGITRFSGGDGDDTFYGSDGPDTYRIGEFFFDEPSPYYQPSRRRDGGADHVYGNGGDDVLEIGGGLASGGPGDDVLTVPSFEGIIPRASRKADDPPSTEGTNVTPLLAGGEGDDRLTSTGARPVQLDPGPGDDVVVGGSEAWLDYTDPAPLTFRVSDGVVDGQGHDTFTGITHFSGGAGADTFYGTAGPDAYWSGRRASDTWDKDLPRHELEAPDVVHGYGGDDFLSVGRGTVFGGDGADLLSAFDGDAWGGSGDDRILLAGAGGAVGGPGDDVLEASAERSTTALGGEVVRPRFRLTGGADLDSLQLRLAEGATVDLASGSLRSAAVRGSVSTLERVLGTRFGDHLLGSRRDDVLDGGSGPDVIRGRGGRDTAVGGPGRDSCRAEVRRSC